jgi:hypothetical protein
MKQLPIEARNGELVSRSDIRQLVSLADKALVTGDDRTCLALVETIYDLLDRQTEGAPAPSKTTETK